MRLKSDIFKQLMLSLKIQSSIFEFYYLHTTTQTQMNQR